MDRQPSGIQKTRKHVFMQNFIIYGGINFLNKLIPFIMLPVVAHLIPDSSHFAIADMFNVLRQFGVQLGLAGLADALYREFFEKKNDVEYQKKVTSTAFFSVLFLSALLALLIVLFKKSITKLFFPSPGFEYLTVYAAGIIFLDCLRNICLAPCRLRNQVAIFLYTGISSLLVNYLFVIVLVKAGMSYDALIYGTLISGVTMFLFFMYYNNRDFSIRHFDFVILRELLKIGIPLVPTAIIYWVFNSADRIMIKHLIGETELGIYAIGSKIASLGLLINTAFSDGWKFFSFSTMKDNDQVNMNSKIFEYLAVLSFTVFITSLPVANLVFRVFFKGGYDKGAIVFPYLFLSPLVLMLLQVLSNQFLIVRKSYMITMSIFFGCILNVVLNYYFIPIFGIKGAAVSTLMANILSLVIISVAAVKLKLHKINFRFYTVIVILTLVLFALFRSKYNTVYCLIVLAFILVTVLYWKDFWTFLRFTAGYLKRHYRV